MSHLDSFIFQLLYSLNPRAVWPGALSLALLMVAAPLVAAVSLTSGSRLVRAGIYTLAAAVLVVLPLHAAVLADYFFYPSYLDHMEASVTAVSWLGWEGHPLYPSPATGDLYSFPYGPIAYQALGVTMGLFGASIASSKILGIMAFGLCQLLSFVLLRRSGASVTEALLITAAQCAIQAGFTSQGYAGGVRSDALIFLAAEAALLAATASVGMINAAVIGLLGGLLVNLKLHGGLYVLPAFTYFIARAEGTQLRMRLTAVSAVAGLLGLLLPFVPGNVSASNYVLYLRIIGEHHHVLLWMFEESALFAGALLAPLGLLYLACGRRLPAGFAVFLPTLAVSVALVTISASENGVGPYHLLAFLPATCWAFSMLRRAALPGVLDDRRIASRGEGVTLAVLVALVFGYGPFTIMSWARSFNTFANAPLVRQGIAEIDRAMADNPGVTFAVGPGDAPFDAQMLRVIPVFHGNPLPIDSSTWKEYESDGVSDESIRRVIAGCRIDLWLLPGHKPFVFQPFGGPDDTYSDDIRALFHANYALWKSGRIFDEWRCTHH